MKMASAPSAALRIPTMRPLCPPITQGANGTWQKGQLHRPFLLLRCGTGRLPPVQVDGKDVDSANYTLTDDGTNVTLKAAYLETLAVGKHTLAIVSQSGTALTTFTITAAPKPPPRPATAAASCWEHWLWWPPPESWRV